MLVCVWISERPSACADTIRVQMHLLLPALLGWFFQWSFHLFQFLPAVHAHPVTI